MARLSERKLARPWNDAQPHGCIRLRRTQPCHLSLLQASSGLVPGRLDVTDQLFECVLVRCQKEMILLATNVCLRCHDVGELGHGNLDFIDYERPAAVPDLFEFESCHHERKVNLQPFIVRRGRAGLPLHMSAGFHPKARMSFPSALAVGIEGTDEVMDVELSHSVPIETLVEVLNKRAPQGLTIFQAEALSREVPKAQIQRVVYEIPVPVARRPAAQAAIGELLVQHAHFVKRQGRKDRVDVRAGLEAIEIVDGVLRIVQRVTRTVTGRPREILEVLGLNDLENQGVHLSRTKVELTS